MAAGGKAKVESNCAALLSGLPDISVDGAGVGGKAARGIVGNGLVGPLFIR